MKQVESRPWLECIRNPPEGEAPYPLLRPASVAHSFPVFKPSPYLSDGMVIFLNYIMRGSFDNVFPGSTIDTTQEKLEELFLYYGVTLPRKNPLRPRFKEKEGSCGFWAWVLGWLTGGAPCNPKPSAPHHSSYDC